MKITAFNATCPFEIGDEIKRRRRVSPGEAECFHLNPAAVVEEVHTITDIVCMHSAKTGKIEFFYELDGRGPLVRIEIAERAAAEVGQTKPVPTSTVNGDSPGFVRFIRRK